ncbi:MAG: hypothetical protein LBG90_02335 [Spirochaetaceae bacterium]|jgi:hypothetical protein|nr:hypothetical protein [Spirochaetaceae bacterium]
MRCFYGRFFAVLNSILLFSACGSEYQDFVLPPKELYAVDAYVNETPLSVSSIIRQNDRIIPYFTGSIRNDPDVQGLIVFLQSSSAGIAGKKVWYTIGAAEELAVLQETGADSFGAKADSYQVISISRFDRDIPPFTLPDSLAIGSYSIIFQILGEKDLLYTVEKPVYFLKDAVFEFKTMHHYRPSASLGTHLVPSGLAILLEAEIESDPRLDPYIFWYDGKERIGGGQVSAGADQLIWQVSEKAGFHTIKAVVYPFMPITANGVVRELSLPVSVKSKNTGYFEKQADSFTHWYKFQSSLADAKAPGEAQRSLISVEKEGDGKRWRSHKDMYGLEVGRHAYFLPDEAFPEGEKMGRVDFHLLPLGDGTIFRAEFKTLDKSNTAPGEAVLLKLSFKERALILTAALGGAAQEESLDLTGLEEFITPSLSFRFSRGHFAAGLTLQESGRAVQNIIMDFDGSIREGKFQLGEAGGAGTTGLVDELGVVFADYKSAEGPSPEKLAEKNMKEAERSS